MTQLWDDAVAARIARDAAMSRVEERSVPWRVVAYDALLAVARDYRYVTSESLWVRLDAMGVSRPIEARAAGPVMMRAVREGVLVHDGYERSTDPKHHRDVQSRYRSLVYGR